MVSFFSGKRRLVHRLADIQFDEDILKELAVFGEGDAGGRRANNGDAIGFEVSGEVKRRLPAELYNRTDALFRAVDF